MPSLHYFLLILIHNFFVEQQKYQTNAQSPSLINYETVQNCAFNQYFDTRRLQCTACDASTIASIDHFDCICPPGLLKIENDCQKCPTGQQISPDGLFCVECSQVQNITAVTGNYCSSCPQGYFRRLSLTKHQTPKEISCLPCPKGYKVSSDTTYCIPCDALDSASCECQNENCDAEELPISSPMFEVELENNRKFESTYLRKNLWRSEKRCRLGDQTECQHLANMCVLQNYKRDGVTSCTLFESIYNSNRESTLYNGVPWLFYYNTETVIELTRGNGINARFRLNSASENSLLQIILVEYSLDGNYLSTQFLHNSNFLFCKQKKEPFHFGTRIEYSCTVFFEQYQKSLQNSFFDFYLLFTDNEGKQKLYALPLVNEQIRQSGVYVNRNSDVSRVCDKMHIMVQVQSSRDGKIMPPYIVLGYKEVTAEQNQRITTDFRINYFKESTRHDTNLQIAMGVLGALSVIWALLLTYSWARRCGKIVIDIATLLKLILFECDTAADMFLAVIFPMAVVITFGYKAQKAPYFTQLTVAQEKLFKAYLITAAILKFVSLVHRSMHLILTKTFFIDWERPTVVRNENLLQPPSRDLTDNHTKSEPVIWRTYLVANEWNELQSYRKTNIAFQMLVTVALLEWVGLKQLALIRPGFSLRFVVEDEDGNVENSLTRFAVNCTVYFLVGLGQWVFNVVVTERLFSDPFHNMIDLCSIANISVLSLTHSLYGYYIHGKSVHGRADTCIAEMNKCLQKERDNLCGERGLEPGADLQTYVAILSKQFSNKLKAITDKINPPDAKELRLTGIEATTAKMETIATAHAEMNRFLMNFIDHSDSGTEYVVRDISFLEAVLDLDFTDISDANYLARDKSEVAFTRTFVYGNEWIFLTFEMILFCTIDLFTKSRILAALITYSVSEVLRQIISVLFTNNLVKSSFVDQRFMI
uniref:Meckelin n=1 Tax=Syphacia muris TaxID=451379 RepID=A0A158R5Z1_9BILA